MAITLKTRRMLWGRAANRCALEGCRIELVIDATETDDASLIGEECHIVAESPSGPRGNSPLTPEQRNEYANLLLLCAVHHKEIDDQPGQFTVEYLHQVKTSHENWVRQSLNGYDAVKQRDDEYYADMIDQFCDHVSIEKWQEWASQICAHGYPKIPLVVHQRLNRMGEWLLSRIWPGRYPQLESSIQNFRLVLQDLLSVFGEHSEPFGADMLATRPFYRIDEWNPEEYERLGRLHESHVDLLEDLMLELTRAANYVCDRVRESFLPSFRLRDGVLLVTSGPHMDLKYHTLRAEYRGAERTERPYPGLEGFKTLREQRDFCFGRVTQQKMESDNNGVDLSGSV